MKTIVISKDGNVNIVGTRSNLDASNEHAEFDDMSSEGRIARREYRVDIDPDRLLAAIQKRGLHTTLLSKEAGYTSCYLSQSMKSKRISLSMLDVLRRHGIRKNEIGADYFPRKVEKTTAVEIDYDRLYEVIKQAMIDALKS